MAGQTRDRRERLLRKREANLCRQERIGDALAALFPLADAEFDRLTEYAQVTYDLLAQEFRLRSLLRSEGVCL